MKVCLVFLMWFWRLSFQAMDTGYPAGLMADCPGMNHTTTLSPKTIQSLSVSVIFPSTNLLLPYQETRCPLDDAACVAKHINLRDKVTQVLIGGYLGASFSPLARSFAAQYLAMKRNVLVLEIFPILIRSYPLAARVTRPLGKLLGQLLVSLSRYGLSSSKLELLGGSLGAHIAAYAAIEFYRLTGQRPARLTGLDPAGPCFRNLPAKAKLHADVAEKVDVLHTNIDAFGIAEPMGHVDFYANGGEYQPKIIGDFIMPCFPLCSHIRAGIYYLIAFDNPDQFIAVGCDSVPDARHNNCYEGEIRSNVLGPKTDFNKTGIFYLPTDSVQPYYLGVKGLKKRKYGVNEYLLIPSPDADITI